jgi:hypothetical protein
MGWEGDAEVSGCDLTKGPKDAPCTVRDEYGLFVAPPAVAEDLGAAVAASALVPSDGSMRRPFPTIRQALAMLGNKTRIYVCAATYSEQVTLTAPVSIYGGLSCAAGPAGPVWAYAGASAQFASPSPAYALSVRAVTSGTVTMEDLSFTSPDAATPGGSSIGAFIVSSSVSLARVTISAGAGADGAAGTDGTATPNYTQPQAPAGEPQAWGRGSATMLSGAYAGGAGAINRCIQSGLSAGGNGGLGCDRGLGMPGRAIPAASATAPGRDGLAMGTGLLDDAGAPITILSNDPGADGRAGHGGVAAPPQVYGILSPSGWTPSGGGDGEPGGPGQGGAGATDPAYGQCTNQTPSIGGGGGGAGGCGGSGGKGGGGGGASVALAAIDAQVHLSACVLTAAAGGKGGAGGAGQDGQAGASGGDDTSFSQLHAAGAPGGNGAGGSGGAGATGGISVGILVMSSAVASDPLTDANIRVGAAGASGAGGGAGRFSPGILPTGNSGNPGAAANPSIAAARLHLM